MYTLLILLAAAAAAAAIFYKKYTCKAREMEALRADLEGKARSLEAALGAKIENLEQESEGLRAERQHQAAALESLSAENAAQRLRIDSGRQKLALVANQLMSLQRAVMTDTGQIKALFPDFFVMYKPWEAAGGDFYKFIKMGPCTVAACGNCGHSGIGGLAKALLDVAFIQEIASRLGPSNLDAGQIMDSLRSKHAHLAERDGQRCADEDIPVNLTICIINEKERRLCYAGAYGSIFLIRKSYPGTSRKENDLHEFRGDRMNFAVSFGRRKNYEQQVVDLEKDDRLYMKTDGFANQRGGESGARFGDPYLRQLIVKHANEPMLEQKRAIEQELDKWRGGCAKGNDILLIGLALKVAGK